MIFQILQCKDKRIAKHSIYSKCISERKFRKPFNGLVIIDGII